MQSDHEVTANPPKPWLNQTWFIVVFIPAVILINFSLLVVAAYDRYWLAATIAILFGPILNITFVVIGLIALRIVRKSKHIPTALHLAITLGLPFVATLFNALVIITSGLDNLC